MSRPWRYVNYMIGSKRRAGQRMGDASCDADVVMVAEFVGDSVWKCAMRRFLRRIVKITRVF
jgi:hypothetical protein